MPSHVPTKERLASLRRAMREHDPPIDALIIPSEDAHSSEYIAACDERRAWISGFDGSAGCAIVTMQEALMFTDGRYFLQAADQMDDNWKLMKQGLPKVPTWQDYITKHLPSSTQVGIDATLISYTDASSISDALSAKDSSLVETKTNLVDHVWGSDRPKRPHEQVYELDVKYTGRSTKDKLDKLRAQLVKREKKGIVITMLDEIAWLFNLRGSDIDYNPVFFSYAIVTNTIATLYLAVSQLEDGLEKKLKGAGVETKPYEQFWGDLEDVGSNLTEEDKILIGKTTSLAVATRIGKDRFAILRSPVTDSKACKNEVEIEGFRQSHIRDGAALARYFAWLEETLEKGEKISEIDGADKLESFRKELELFRGLSFDTISSTGSNAAVIHYKPRPGECKIIDKNEIYLCDSGAQFLDGTTDTTRTWHFGTSTQEEKRAFTRVLQGHIAIDELIFPDKTSGYQLDPFARRALWEDGLDYRHGTGHGVGHFLNVHEGPQGIGTRVTLNDTHLREGMVLSNEPGYYEDGKFGIRIENIVVVQKAKTPNNFGDKQFFRFEHVTMSPMHRKLIDVNLISERERKWVDAYHEEVFKKVSPLLKNDQRAFKWLERETRRL